LVDLGRWVNEEYRVPGPPAVSDLAETPRSDFNNEDSPDED